MNGIGGYQQGLLYQDGLYGGLLVKAGTGLNVRVAEGLAIVGTKIVEQGAAGAAVDIAVPDNAVTQIYVNHPDAKDGAGADIATFDKVKEADKSMVNINGSTGTVYGRSILLAEITTAAGAITKVDNTVRIQLKNIPAAMFTQNLNQ